MKLFIYASYIPTIIVSVVLFLITLKSKEKNISLNIIPLSLTIWILCLFLADTAHSTKWALIWSKAALVGPIILILSLATFLLKKINSKEKKLLLYSFYILSIPLFLFINSKKNISTVTIKSWGTEAIPGELYSYFLFFTLVVLIVSWLNIFTKRKKINPKEKKQLKTIFYGVLITFSFGLITNIILMLLKVPQFSILGPISALIFVTVLIYSAIKENLINIRFLISSTIAKIIGIAIFILTYSIIFSGYISYISVTINIYFTLFSICYSFIFGAYINHLKNFIITLAEKIFLKDKYDYKKALVQISSDMSNAGSLEDVVQILNKNFLDEIEIYPIYTFFPEGFTERRDISKTLVYNPFYLENSTRQAYFKLVELDPSHIILTEIKKEKKVILYKEASNELKTVLKENHIEALIPCFNQKEELIALFFTDKKLSEAPYSEDDISLLEALSATLPPILQRIKQARVSAEMDVAQRIQMEILPKNPQLPNLELACFMKPADEVGGDYYDVYDFDGQSWIVLGDVAGHGVGSGLVMFMVQSIMATLIYSNPSIAPNDLNYIANKILCKNFKRLMDGGRPITILTLRSEDGRIFDVSGSHDNFFIYRAESNSIEEQKVEHFPFGLGFDEDLPKEIFELEKVHLNSGDILLLITDGITEAFKNGIESEEQYGERRLKSFLLKHHDKSMDTIKELLLEDLEKYTQKIFFDDVTFILAKAI